jgi:hypothetical protein
MREQRGRSINAQYLGAGTIPCLLQAFLLTCSEERIMIGERSVCIYVADRFNSVELRTSSLFLSA